MAVVFTYRASTYFAGTGGSTFTASPAWTPAAGSLLIAFVAGGHTTPASPSGVTGHGATYTKSGFDVYVGSNHVLSVWVALAGASPTSAGAAATFATGPYLCDVVEFEVTGWGGTTAASAVVQTKTNSSSAGTTGTVTLSAAGSAANRPIAFFLHLAAEFTTPRTNWTMPGNANWYNGAYVVPASGTGVEYRSDAFETTASATWGTSSQWGGVALEIKAAPTTTTKTITGQGDIKKTGVLKTITGQALIKRPTLQTITGQGNIKKTALRTLAGVSAIKKTTVANITGRSLIRVIVSQTVTGTGLIQARTLKAITGRGDIAVLGTTRTLDGRGAIQVTQLQTVSGIGLIAVPSMRLLNIQVQATTFANQVVFLGGFFGVSGIELRSVANDTASQTALGRIISTIVVDRTLATQAAVDLAAAIELESREAQYSIAFETDFDGLEVGMLITLVAVNAGISGSYVINTLSMRQRSMNATVYSCTVGSYRGTLAERLRALAVLKTLQPSVPPPPNSVGSTQLQNGAVGSLQLAAAAVQTSNIAVAAITNAVIAASAITATEIGNNAITTPKIFAGAVVTASLAAGSVTGAKIQAGSITAANAVFGAGAILTADIGTAQITDAKIATLSASKLTAGTIDASSINVINLSASSIGAGTMNVSSGSLIISGSGIHSFLQVQGGADFEDDVMMAKGLIVNGMLSFNTATSDINGATGMCTMAAFRIGGTVIVDNSRNANFATLTTTGTADCGGGYTIYGVQVVGGRIVGTAAPSFTTLADAQSYCATLRSYLLTHGLIG